MKYDELFLSTNGVLEVNQQFVDEQFALFEVDRTKNDLDLLDIGGGDGEFSLTFAEFFNNVSICEISEKALAVIHGKVKERGLKNVKIFDGRWKNELKGKKFDTVVLFSVAYYMESNFYNVLKDITPFLKKDGTLLISVMKDSLVNQVFNLVRKIVYWAPATRNLFALILYVVISLLPHKRKLSFGYIKKRMELAGIPLRFLCTERSIKTDLSQHGFKLLFCKTYSRYSLVNTELLIKAKMG